MTTEKPLISVIICTYNRDKYIPQALESVYNQTFDKNKFELIVIDNFCTDNTAAIVKQFIAEHPDLNAQYLFEGNKGVSFARNLGLKVAKAPLLVYMDDDAILSPEHLVETLKFFNDYPDAVGFGGKTLPKYEDGIEPPWVNKYLNGFVGRIDHGPVVKKYSGKMKYPAGCNMGYRKAILEQAGGFNNDLTFRSDDKYMYFKVKEITDEVYFLPYAWAYHYVDARRLEFENFKRLFLKTGHEEKVRLRREENSFQVFRKFMDLGIKFLASLILYFGYVFRGREPKGRYLIFAMWFTFKGFLSKSVFVR